MIQSIDFCFAVLSIITFAIATTMLVTWLAGRRRTPFRHTMWVGCLGLVIVSPLIPIVHSMVPYSFSYRFLPKVEGVFETARNVETRRFPDGVKKAPTVVPTSTELRTFADDAKALVATKLVPNETPARPDFAMGTFLLWISGCIFGLVRVVFGFWSVRRTVLRAVSVDREDLLQQVEEAKLQLGMSGRYLHVLMSQDSQMGPFVTGILQPKLVVDRRFIAQDQAQWRDILLHELAHIKKRHLTINLASRIVRILFWFHPLVHVLYHQTSRVGEEICDNAVLLFGNAKRYAETLLEYSGAQTDLTLPTVGLISSSWKLEDRIQHLFEARRDRGIAPSSTAICSALAVGLLAFPLSHGIRSQERTKLAFDEQPGDQRNVDVVRENEKETDLLEFLPQDTIGYVRFRNFDSGHIKRIANHDKFQNLDRFGWIGSQINRYLPPPMASGFDGNLEATTDVENNLGISLAHVARRATKQLCLAIVRRHRTRLCIAMAQADDVGAAKGLVDEFASRFDNPRFVISKLHRQKIGPIVQIRSTVGPNTSVFGGHVGALFFVVESMDILDEILGLIRTPNTGLSSERHHQRMAFQSRLPANGDTPSISWFEDPKKTTDSSAGRARRRVFELANFQVIKAVGGTVNYPLDGPFFTKHRSALVCDRPFDGSARLMILQTPNEGVANLGWIPSDIIGLTTFYLDPSTIIEDAAELVGAIAGDPSFLPAVLESIRSDPSGPKIDVRSELLVHLTGRISGITVANDKKIERIYALELSNAAKMRNSVEKAFWNDPTATKTDIGQTAAWRIGITDQPSPSVTGVAVWENHLLFSTSYEALEKLLLSKEKRLLATNGFQTLDKHLDRISDAAAEVTLIARQGDSLRPPFFMAADSSRNGTPIWKRLFDLESTTWLNENANASALSISGSSDSWTMTGFELRGKKP